MANMTCRTDCTATARDWLAGRVMKGTVRYTKRSSLLTTATFILRRATTCRDNQGGHSEHLIHWQLRLKISLLFIYLWKLNVIKLIKCTCTYSYSQQAQFVTCLYLPNDWISNMFAGPFLLQLSPKTRPWVMDVPRRCISLSRQTCDIHKQKQTSLQKLMSQQNSKGHAKRQSLQQTFNLASRPSGNCITHRF